jgi:hypothetical protein
LGGQVSVRIVLKTGNHMAQPDEVLRGWAEGRSSSDSEYEDVPPSDRSPQRSPSPSEDEGAEDEVRQVQRPTPSRAKRSCMRNGWPHDGGHVDPADRVPAEQEGSEWGERREQGVHQAAIDQDANPGVGRYAVILQLPEDPSAEEFQIWYDRQGWGLWPVKCPVRGCTSTFRLKQRVPVDVGIQRAPGDFLGHCKGGMHKDQSHDAVFFRMQAMINRVRLNETIFRYACRQHRYYMWGAALPTKHAEAFNAFEASVRRGEIQMGPDSEDFYQVWGDVLEGKDVRARVIIE